MKILSAKQIKEADKISLEKQDISSTELMERAASLVFEEIHKRLEGAQIPVKIFCGIGNNGGDGLVIGRQLLEAGYEVTIYVVNYSDQRSKDFLVNYDRIKNLTTKWPVLLKSEADFPEISYGDFVVDAIFGVGLNRPLVDWVANLVKHINKSGAFVLSIDLPSGLMADAPVEDKESIVKANYTITFQAPKLAFYLPETAGFVGDLQILDIGLDKEYLQQAPAVANLISRPEAKALYKPRQRFTHKGTYGHALIIGGSYGKIGSVCLTATGALRAGAGLVTIYAPKCGYEILQTTLPEAMVITDPHMEILTNIEYDIDPDVIGLGVGIGTKEETIEAMKNLLKGNKKPMVIDADGLNILSKNADLLNILPEGTILTPHPKELERLIGAWKNDFEKLEKVKRLAAKHEFIILIKGTYTFTVTPDDLFINTTGNPGMATAGSGDVLTGILTALIGQGYEPLRATILGVYLHGKAGDIAAEKLSYEGVVAGDIARHTGAAIFDLFETQLNNT
ncbi:bifunctional ADP-dependent NAD(P)H-hydrate dehydratase/NAD(P)H-hydrate epimerase [Salinimicrobium xinjiangense]|uniref:bifunctional ADP-dependent NAD(P)H-hydrate dehydratase/NAD(P)H-hydrate epimerase n=1 Tax=Salinimicrobium xinjiangense TaxID=438596 RepID=UPI0003F993E1|nr:bifunctional ADP-dependent NAD(P)H-hydrate dehydratase/NAD(P)H-hydrate epimerase [Salinimicrobium xinjiangense]